MGPPARIRQATYDDVLRAPPHLVAEILGGELVLSPRPTGEHGRTETGLAADLLPRFGRRRGGSGPGGWWIVAEIELHFGTQVVVPDLSGWRRERMVHPPTGAFQTLAPDWLCEITSPSTAGIDRIRKMPLYRAEGVRHVWLCDPLQHTLEVYRLTEAGYTLVQAWQGDERVRAEPFEAEELDIGEWWVDDTAALDTRSP